MKSNKFGSNSINLFLAFWSNCSTSNSFLPQPIVSTTLYLLLFALLIILFSFFYTLTIAFDPEKVSEDLKQSGGTIPTIRAGAETSDYLEKVVTRITFGSAVFLAILGISPNIWFGYVLRGPVLLGGTSLLILVGVAVELLQQIDSYLAVKKMKGFIRK